MGSMRGERWGTGDLHVYPPAHEKSQNYRVLIGPDSDLLKNQNATKPAFNVGPLSERQCFAAGVSLVYR